jgi:hypothetical protein
MSLTPDRMLLHHLVTIAHCTGDDPLVRFGRIQEALRPWMVENMRGGAFIVDAPKREGTADPGPLANPRFIFEPLTVRQGQSLAQRMLEKYCERDGHDTPHELCVDHGSFWRITRHCLRCGMVETETKRRPTIQPGHSLIFGNSTTPHLPQGEA